MVLKGVAWKTVFAHLIPLHLWNVHNESKTFSIQLLTLTMAYLVLCFGNKFNMFVCWLFVIRLFPFNHFHLNSAKSWFYDIRRRGLFSFSCFALHSGVIFVYGHFKLQTELHETWTFSIYTKCWIEIERIKQEVKYRRTATTTSSTEIIHENNLHHRYGSFKMNNFFNDFFFLLLLLFEFILFCFVLLRQWGIEHAIQLDRAHTNKTLLSLHDSSWTPNTEQITGISLYVLNCTFPCHFLFKIILHLIYYFHQKKISSFICSTIIHSFVHSFEMPSHFM